MRWKSITNLFKFVLFFILIVVLILMISHIAMQYDVQAGEVQHFLSSTWLLWLGVRISLYAIGGYFLYQLWKLAKNEQDELAYKKLIRACMIGVVLIEFTNIVQLLRG